MWLNISNEGVIFATYCPFDYCTKVRNLRDLDLFSNSQCALYRAGRLCGGCSENHSLAIGSSHCIHCPNNNHLALFIFFAVAGFLLVFFISVLNVTIAQGMVNGLIFYANILWTYQTIFFPLNDRNAFLDFLKVFIAWINLDFGIETCFINGLTSFWKTWLQYVFPFYIWTIAGVMIATAKYSNRTTKMYGNRAVPVLATLFLLSYMKLLRIAVTSLSFSILISYPEGSTLAVWAVDGNLTYFGGPHVALMLIALIVFACLWLPYTLTLLLHQQLQKVSYFKLLRFINKLMPFYDVHFAPIKDKHRYWFGVLLLTRGILLLSYGSTFAIPQNTSLLILLVLGALVLFYMTIVQPYKSTVVLTLQSSFLLHLILLSGFVLYAQSQMKNKQAIQTAAVGFSVGAAFLQFIGIVVYNILTTSGQSNWVNSKKADDRILLHEGEGFSAAYRESILAESIQIDNK